MSNLEKEICKFWKRGLPCDFGEKCRFLHAELYKPKRSYMDDPRYIEKGHFVDKYDASENNLRRHYSDSRNPTHELTNQNRDSLQMKGYKSSRTIGSVHRSPSISNPDQESGFKHMGKIHETDFKNDEILPFSSISSQKHRRVVPNIGVARKRFRGESDYHSPHESRETEETKFGSAFSELLNHADYITHSIENDWKELQKKMKSNLLILYDMENMLKSESEDIVNQRMVNENMLLNAIALEKENQMKVTQARLHEEKAIEMKTECERLRDESEKISSEYSLQSSELQGKLNKLSEAQKNLNQREREMEEKAKRIEKREQEVILKESRIKSLNSNSNSNSNDIFFHTNVLINVKNEEIEKEKMENVSFDSQKDRNNEKEGEETKENNEKSKRNEKKETDASISYKNNQNNEKNHTNINANDIKKEEITFQTQTNNTNQSEGSSLPRQHMQNKTKSQIEPPNPNQIKTKTETGPMPKEDSFENSKRNWDKTANGPNLEEKNSNLESFRNEIFRNSKFSENGFENRKNEILGSSSRKPFFRKKILKTENFLKKKIYLEEIFSRDAPQLLTELNKYGLLNELELYDELFFEEEILGSSENEKEAEKDDKFLILNRILNKMYAKENGKKSVTDTLSANNGNNTDGRNHSDSFGVLRHYLGKLEPRHYRIEILAAIFQQCKSLQKNGWPFSWSWCSKLSSFLFVFDRHNRIIIESPFYGHATYFFEIEDDLSLKWQLKRLIFVLSASSVSRSDLLENRVAHLDDAIDDDGDDDAILKHFGMHVGVGIGSMLNFVDRIFHDHGKVNSNDEDLNVSIQNWIERVGSKLREGINMGRKTRNGQA